MIGLADDFSEKTIEINNISPGILIEQEIKLALYDSDRQIMNLDSTSQINIVPYTPGSSIKRISNSKVVNGKTTFSKMSFSSKPGSSNVIYKIVSGSVDTDKVKNVFNDSIVQPNIVINFSY